MVNYGSLFSGAGLGDFGFELAGFECKWQIENNDYCQKILNLRWPDVKKYGDIKKVKPEELEKVDLITGGFPCQPFSTAGKRKGKEDDRNLWPEMFRIIKNIKPRWVVAENVPGIIPLYLDTILSNLEAENYKVWPIIFSSHSLGAWHRRERLWIVGYTQHNGQFTTEISESIRERSNKRQEKSKQTRQFKGPSKQYETLANTRFKPEGNKKRRFDSKPINCKASEQPTIKGNGFTDSSKNIWRNFWAIEPSVGRVVNGCANRIHRLKALGNGQTPCSTFLIGKFIMEIEKKEAK